MICICTRIIREKENEDTLTLVEYLNNVSLYSERNEEKGKDCVKIMTIHNAKGLEFPCVFVVSLNEGILPSSHAYKPDEVEQERRVAYVAFTRAEDYLFLSSDIITCNYDGSLAIPSRFLKEVGIKNTGSPKYKRDGKRENGTLK